MEAKTLAIISRGKRTTMFASVFVFALLACTAFLALYSPGKIVTNPMGRSQTWFPPLFAGSNSSESISIFSFIFPKSGSASSATLDDRGSVFKSNTEDPHNLTAANAPDGRNRMANADSPQAGAEEKGPESRKNGKENGPGIVKNNTQSTVGQANKNLTQAPAALRTGARENTTNGTYAGDLKVAKSGPSSDAKGNASATPQGGGSVWGNIKHCDIFSGRWVRDDSYPYYPAGSCPHIDESFDCFRNRRPDNEYEKWRWQPNGCNIPRLNATDMLERLRGKRLVFVGDSLNRNMWESLVCILRNSVRDKERVYEVSGRHEFKTEGFYAFRYEDYNCSVEFVRTPFLVQEWEMPDGNGTVKETLRLDVVERSAFKYRDADVVVFNTGHWWTHEKTSQGKDYYQEGNRVYSKLNVVEAYGKALRTWAAWVDRNINRRKTQVFFRGYSASHFRGGQWNSGGQCHTEILPIFNESYLIMYPPKMNVLESVLKEMKTPVMYLNITRMTDYRKDGHPSVYRKQYLTQEERMAPERYQDCSHWCLPGVPDAWNELLYASLLIRGQGVWAT